MKSADGQKDWIRAAKNGSRRGELALMRQPAQLWKASNQEAESRRQKAAGRPEHTNTPIP